LHRRQQAFAAARTAFSCGKLEQFGGAVAQLGARLDGIEEVVGSNPIGSTILFNHMRLWRGFYDRICVTFCAVTTP